jgi:translation initiation factor 2B subunit (eIF-2B alpha/beta/delta family)
VSRSTGAAQGFAAWAAARHTGAAALTRDAAALLLAGLERLPVADEAALGAALRRYGEAHPAYGSLWRLLDRVARVAQKCRREALPEAESRRHVGEALERFSEDLALAVAGVAREGAALIPEGAAVVTYSRSGSVEGALLEARSGGRRFRVVLSESRPALEGMALVRSLAGAGIPCVYATDAALAVLLSRARILLVGADAVLPSGFLNTAGTWPLLLAAREASVPAYCLAPRAKFLAPVPGTIALPLHEPGAVLATPPPHVDVVNAPFEEVPMALVRGVVTESGLLTPGEASLSAQDSALHASLGAPLDA